MTLRVVLQRDVISRDAQRPDGRLGSFALGRSKIDPLILFEGINPTPSDLPTTDPTGNVTEFGSVDYDIGL